MPWVEKVPRRYDFCGRPPCEICYDWIGPDGEPSNAIVQMGVEMLGREPDANEREQLIEINRNIHTSGQAVASAPPESLPPADIGMSDSDHMNRWLQDQRQVERSRPQTRQLTCDDIADREEARQRERQQTREAIQEYKKMARAMQEVQREIEEEEEQAEQKERQAAEVAYQEQQLIATMGPRSVGAARSLGLTLMQYYENVWLPENRGRSSVTWSGKNSVFFMDESPPVTLTFMDESPPVTLTIDEVQRMQSRLMEQVNDRFYKDIFTLLIPTSTVINLDSKGG